MNKFQGSDLRVSRNLKRESSISILSMTAINGSHETWQFTTPEGWSCEGDSE